MLYLYLSHLIWFLGILGFSTKGIFPIKNFILTFSNFSSFTYFSLPFFISKFTQGTLFLAVLDGNCSSAYYGLIVWQE